MRASVSKINTFLRCPRKAYYRYDMKIRRILKAPKPLFGVIGHAAIEADMQGKPWTDPVDRVMADLDKLPLELQAEYRDIPLNLAKVLQGYFQLYKRPAHVVAVERKFVVPLPDSEHEAEGILDLVYREDDGIWVQDHKFVKQIPTDSIRFYDLQTNIYYYAATQIYPELAGIEFDYIRSQPPKLPAILKNGEVSRAACDTDLATYMRTVLKAGKDPHDYAEMVEKLRGNAFYARYRVPRPEALVRNIVRDFVSACDLMHEAMTYGMHPRRICRDCSWDCEYHDLCMAELTESGTAKDLLETEFEPDVRGEDTDGTEDVETEG